MEMQVSDDRVGIKLSREISVKVAWKGLFKTLVDNVENVVKTSQGDILSAGKLLVGALEAFGAFKPEVPMETRALELIILSFAVSVDYTSAATNKTRDDVRGAMRAAIERCKIKAERGDLFIPFDFFEAPHLARVYVEMRNDYLKTLFDDLDNVASEGYRLDQAFRAGVWELWHSRLDTFEDLANALSSPVAEISDLDRQWKKYRAHLISEFQVKPVFGQEESLVSLSSLYIPLRCSWKVSGEELPTSFELPNRRSESQYLCVDWIENQLSAWLDNSDPHDWLRLIGGGPGSGKSTSARAFAAKVAERHDVQPMFIPLQRLDSHLKLRDAINNYFVSRTGSPFLSPPLDRRFVESAPRLLLIFDGLDEIARPGESANAIARDMVDRIRSLYNELTGDGSARHKILVTGRTVSFDAARLTADRKGNEAIEVVNYAKISSSRAVATSGDKSLLEVDQRPAWWQNYSAVFGRSPDLPEAFSDPRLNSITSEPLLCYLLALSGYLEENAKEAAGNRSKIYVRLLEDVWRRGWGGGRVGPGRQLDQSNFDRLFEAMALAAWHGGDERLATYDRFEKALEIMRAREIFEDFTRLEGSDVSNLAVNFYMKHADASGKGFEFTHKSFGEYLTARAIFRVAEFAVSIVEFREELAATEWLNGVSTGVLSNELLAFLRDEARLRAENSLPACVTAKKKLEQIFNRVLREGFPHIGVSERTWREAENAQRSAEGLLLAVINAYAIAIAEHDQNACLMQFDWPTEFSLGELIHRQRGVRNQDIAVQNVFSYIKAEDQVMLGVEIINFDFRYSELSSIRFFRSILTSAIFDGAKLTDIEFSHAALSRSSFDGARLEGVEFSYCMMEDMSFTSSKLKTVTFRRSVMDGSSFDLVELENIRDLGKSFQNTDVTDIQKQKISTEKREGDEHLAETKGNLRRLVQTRKKSGGRKGGQ